MNSKGGQEGDDYIICSIYALLLQGCGEVNVGVVGAIAYLYSCR